MPHSAKKTSAKKADTTALPSRTKVGSVSKSSNKAKPHGTVKSSQSNRMKSTLSDSDGDREGSPVKRAKREIAPAPSVETSSSAGSSSSTVLPNTTSSLVYPNIDSTPAVSTEQDSSVKRAKNQADSTVASQRGVTVITSIGEKEIAPPAISPPDSPLPSLPDGNSNPNETSAQKKLRKLRWNRMLEAELPFLVAEAQTKLAMHKILQGAREMEKILIKAMEEDDSKPLTQEERDAREIASMQKLREANERFDRQFRMELESVLVDSHGLC